MIRAGGAPVFVRRVAGVPARDDALIADGSPVLVSTSAEMQVGGEQWRAIRGLNGVVGWVPSAQLVVDGEAPSPLLVSAVMTPTRVASGSERVKIANTDGAGVVLRNTPNDGDRSRSGLMDDMPVTVMERVGAEWLRVRADNGAEGWVPSRYVISG